MGGLGCGCKRGGPASSERITGSTRSAASGGRFLGGKGLGGGAGGSLPPAITDEEDEWASWGIGNSLDEMKGAPDFWRGEARSLPQR